MAVRPFVRLIPGYVGRREVVGIAAVIEFLAAVIGILAALTGSLDAVSGFLAAALGPALLQELKALFSTHVP